MFRIVATTRMGHDYRISKHETYEAAARRISRLSQVLPGWKFRIERRVSVHS